MAWSDIQVKVTYEQVGDTHLLIHAYCRNFINYWMLLDLEELSQGSGKSVEEVLTHLRNNLRKQE